MLVKQVQHVFALLELFERTLAPMTLTQIATELALPKSSTFNLLRTLLEMGYLYEVRPRAGYYPTRRLFDTASAIARGDPLITHFRDELEKLGNQTQETILLSARDGDHVVYVDVIESPLPVRYAARVGDRRPVYATSGGKAILSTYAAEKLAAELQQITYTQHRPGTHVTARALEADLAASAARGWFENLSEFTPDVTGVGLPLVLADRHFALSVAGPNYRMENRHAEIAGMIRATIANIQNMWVRLSPS